MVALCKPAPSFLPTWPLLGTGAARVKSGPSEDWGFSLSLHHKIEWAEFADTFRTENIFSNKRSREVIVYNKAGFPRLRSIKLQEIITTSKQA